MEEDRQINDDEIQRGAGGRKDVCIVKAVKKKRKSEMSVRVKGRVVVYRRVE